jgi:PAS domain-containing protein
MSATLLGLGGCVLAAVGGVVCARRGHRLAYVFLLSWGVLILFAVGIALSAFGWIPRTLVSEYGLQLGAAAQMVVLSLALVYRIHLLRTEKQQLEHEAERAASRKHLQEQLQQALDERNTILENSLVAIVFLNPDGRVLWANAATGLMFGLTQGLPVGETLDAFYPSVDDCRKAHAVVHGAIADGRPFEDERACDATATVLGLPRARRQPAMCRAAPCGPWWTSPSASGRGRNARIPGAPEEQASSRHAFSMARTVPRPRPPSCPRPSCCATTWNASHPRSATTRCKALNLRCSA